MRVSITAAMGQNRVIGDAAGLPWHLPRDLRHFRELTYGKPVVVGRVTLEHIGRALPGRTNIVLTRRRGYSFAGVQVAHSVLEAMALAHEAPGSPDEIMVIGGGEVYRAFLPIADRLYLTVVQGRFAGTATFPAEALDDMPLEVTECEDFSPDALNRYAYTYRRLDRRRSTSTTPPSTESMTQLLGVA